MKLIKEHYQTLTNDEKLDLMEGMSIEEISKFVEIPKEIIDNLDKLTEKDLRDLL